eukprot:TRINITY_DN935_c0_g9_i1.p4 TRINITY_DN935_c0_g9~~TRINITY_DN935_c0_g9_i1.p4  ORF type:complete len:108 (+),score=16.29 TRINITY_DN935_c0_g9_i1:565-888(+)
MTRMVCVLHREIRELLFLVEKLTSNAIEGETLKVNFRFPAELTEEVTLALYKWLMLISSYSVYKNVLSIPGDNEMAGAEEVKGVLEERAKADLARKYVHCFDIEIIY